MSTRENRELAWPPRPGDSFNITEFVEELTGEIEALNTPDGGVVLLVETRGGGDEELIRLIERLCDFWQGQSHSSVVVDCHPAAPIGVGLFEDEPEGFTEMLHYGVSPHKLARPREGVAGHWIPAGAPWSLPLENPGEPQRSIKRLANIADRVILLASADNEEGLLEALRESAACRLILGGADAARPVHAAPEPPEPVVTPARASNAVSSAPEPELPVAVAAEPEGEPEQDSPGEFSLDQRRRRLPTLFWVLPLIALVAMAWWWRQSVLSPDDEPGGILVARQVDGPLTHLPEAVNPRIEGGEQPTDSAVSGDGGNQPLTPADQSPPVSEEDLVTRVAEAGGEAAPTNVISTPKAAGTEAGEVVTRISSENLVPPARAGDAETPRRRFESKSRWTSALDHSGSYLVHVESYRDSSLGVSSARRRGFGSVGFELLPARVKGGTWYRLCVGPFPDLNNAAAYRDSLLDRAGVEYCVIHLDLAD